MRSMRMAVLVGVLVVLGSMPAAAQGAPVLDQSQEHGSGAAFVLGFQGSAVQSLGQTFTAGLSGPLDEVDLLLQPVAATDAITGELRTVSAGLPTDVVLATATLPAAGVPASPAFVTVAFGAPAVVAAGTMYAIVAYTSATSLYGWRGTLTDSYPAGNADGSFTYTPFEDTVGTDSFTYHASDGTGDSEPVTVTITVQVGCDGRRATQVGTAGNDELGGSSGNDVIVGLGGNDVIEPGSGTDIVCGGPGRDNVRAGSGNDTVFGGPGDDLLDGGSGNDRLFGEAGSDRLLGGGENDGLDGGGDSPDRCDGEGGSDTATACESVSGVP